MEFQRSEFASVELSLLQESIEASLGMAMIYSVTEACQDTTRSSRHALDSLDVVAVAVPFTVEL